MVCNTSIHRFKSGLRLFYPEDFLLVFLFEIGFIITCIILQKSLYCQSTLSKSIRALEDEYKVILINREAKKFDVISVDK